VNICFSAFAPNKIPLTAKQMQMFACGKIPLVLLCCAGFGCAPWGRPPSQFSPAEQSGENIIIVVDFVVFLKYNYHCTSAGVGRGGFPGDENI
jgi:hypothetical protein